MLRVFDRVIAIRIDHQRHVGEPLAYCAHHLDVGASFDFHLDAVIAGRDRFRNRIDQFRGRFLDADADAGRNRSARKSEQLVERDSFTPRDQVDQRILNRRLRHAVTAHALKAALQLGQSDIALDDGQKKVFDDVVRRRRRLGGVVRIGIGDAFSPTADSIAIDAKQKRFLRRPRGRAD